MTQVEAAPALLTHYDQMLRLRRFEERIERLHAQGAIRGSTHLGIGQEAVAVGARAGLRAGDLVAPTYRSHNWALAWGTPLDAAFGEMLGKATGCNGGFGGSKHLADAEHGVLPANAIVAAALPIACGTAWRAKLDGDDQVSVVPFGDGATNQAVFHEAMNLAAIWSLPVLFVCENNRYSEMTPIKAMAPYEEMVRRADSYDMPAVGLDGMDVRAVAEGVGAAAERARAGEGPTFIEAHTYRFCGHMPGDTEPYRTPEEVERERERDPLLLARTQLLADGVSEQDLQAVEASVDAAIDAAEDAARAAAEPDRTALAHGLADFMETTR
jgi:acetoin:2,6-dichlorophenolindophenol oxidoreductase subunit alpha